MKTLPAGTVTFLFTDIEGSTKLWERVPNKMKYALQRHHEILRCAIESNEGVVFQIVGDAFCAAFHTAPTALSAAVKAQIELVETHWDLPNPIRVRMGIHTGVAQPVEGESTTGGYSSNQTLNRVSRIMSAGHGGQILLSLATEELCHDTLPENTRLQDLGQHHLRDVIHPEHLFQLNVSGSPCDFPPLKTLDLRRHNLPVQLTEFIGREKELAEVDSALAQNRLVTLLGSGGTGKTRLAIEAGAVQITNSQTDDRFHHGVYFVALAPLERVEAIVPTIASALGFSFYEGGEPRQQLLDYLREKSLLLILDNFEHLLADTGLVTDILRSAPNAKILVTSRTRLNVEGEQLFHLTGMQFPNWEAPQDAAEYGAVKLFMQTARRVRPDFELTTENLRFVVRLCRLVEGIPLGILLAASWMELLSPEEIANEIEKNLDFLEARQHDLPTRQQSMRAVFDYSWKLLTPGEQNAFMKASVFRGGFTHEAVQQVTGASLRDLMGLVDKSLLHRDVRGRYSLHELLRQYANEKLLESGESNSTHTRHLEYFLQLAEDAEPRLHGSEQHDWLERLDFEHDNLRGALDWSLNEGCVEKGMRLAYALLWFWDIRAYWSEGLEVTRKLLMQPEALPRTLLRANTLLTAASFSGYLLSDDSERHYLEESIGIAREHGEAGKRTLVLGLGSAIENFDGGDLKAAQAMVDEALSIARGLGDKWLLGFALAYAGKLSISGLQHSSAQKLLGESFELFQSLGDRHWSTIVSSAMANEDIRQGDFTGARQRFQQALPFLREGRHNDTIVSVLNALGVMAHAEENFVLAKDYYIEALKIAREVGVGIFSPAKNLGCILLYEGDPEGAKALFAECMDIALHQRTRTRLGYAIQSYASLAAFDGQARRAIVLLAATRKIQDEAPDKTILSPAGEYDFARTLRTARETLDDATFNAAWDEGYGMTAEQAVQLALAEK